MQNIGSGDRFAVQMCFYRPTIESEMSDAPHEDRVGSFSNQQPDKLYSFCKFQTIRLATRIVHAKFQIFWNFFGF